MKRLIESSFVVPFLIVAAIFTAWQASFDKLTLQQGAWLAAVVGAALTGLKALQDWKLIREQHAAEFRWKKGELAIKALDAMLEDPNAKNALTLVDWSGHEFILSTGQKVRIDWNELAPALRTHKPGKMEFTECEYFIRNSFDGLFDHLQRIQHLINIELIEEEDIRHPLRYWAGRMLNGDIPGGGVAIREFMRTYDYDLALALVEKLLIERPMTSKSRTPLK